MHDAAMDDPLTDFLRWRGESEDESVEVTRRPVYRAGTGPAVLVLPEMPGISPDVARFARAIRDAGFTVFLPSLFGRDGRYPYADEGRVVLRRACVRAEFGALVGGSSAPVTAYLRALARDAFAECGGVGVGVVGMCFTGGFALSTMLEPSVIAPVLCQPSLPLHDGAAVQASTEELVAIANRLERDDLTVRAYRFAGDVHCRAERFARYAASLGPRFEARVLPDAAANRRPPPFFADVVGGPHSVVTAHLVDEAGHPTIEARDEIVAFLRQRLKGGGHG